MTSPGSRGVALACGIAAAALLVAAVITWIDPDIIVPADVGMTWGIWINLAIVGVGLAVSLTFDAVLLWSAPLRPRAARWLIAVCVIAAGIVTTAAFDVVAILTTTRGIGTTVGYLLVHVVLWVLLIVAAVVTTVLIVRTPRTDER